MSIRELPPGQRELPAFPRFGLGLFAERFPAQPQQIAFEVRGHVRRSLELGAALAELPRVEQISDFHCVTTWSCRSLHWSGFRFADFYERLVVPQAQPDADARLVVFRGEDGYASSLPLADLLAADVMLADRLGDQPLGVDHGAPLRLVAPAHYGYKNVKHIVAIEFWRDRSHYRFPRPYPALMDHPRARVALEERVVGLPAWLVRPFYRLLVPSTIRRFRKTLAQHLGR